MIEKREAYDNLFTTAERKQLIAESLKVLRKVKKYTQKEIADDLGINAQTYATYERGRNEPPAEILVRLSYIYDMPVDMLIQRDNRSKNKIAFEKQMEELEEAIDVMRSKVLSGDSQMREQLKEFSYSLEKMADAMKLVNETIEKNKQQ